VITGLSSATEGVAELEAAAENRVEMRDCIAKLWGMFPHATTLGELYDEIKQATGIANAITALTAQGLTTEQARLQLASMGWDVRAGSAVDKAFSETAHPPQSGRVES